MLCAMLCLPWCQLEKLVATRMVSCATQRSFFVNDQTLPLLTTTARITTKCLLASEPRSRTGMAWGGRGLLVQLLSPACSPSCTHSQELEIFQSALFTTLAKLFIQNIMNVPVVHKQACLFLSTWNGNFLCSPSGRILHCYYKRWVNPRKWGKTAHVQLSRKKKKRCTNFFWPRLDQLPCLQHELWFLLHIWEVFEPPFHFPFFTVVIWPVWFHFAALGHLLFKIMFIFYPP